MTEIYLHFLFTHYRLFGNAPVRGAGERMEDRAATPSSRFFPRGRVDHASGCHGDGTNGEDGVIPCVARLVRSFAARIAVRLFALHAVAGARLGAALYADCGGGEHRHARGATLTNSLAVATGTWPVVGPGSATAFLQARRSRLASQRNGLACRLPASHPASSHATSTY